MVEAVEVAILQVVEAVEVATLVEVEVVVVADCLGGHQEVFLEASRGTAPWRRWLTTQKRKATGCSARNIQWK